MFAWHARSNLAHATREGLIPTILAVHEVHLRLQQAPNEPVRTWVSQYPERHDFSRPKTYWLPLPAKPISAQDCRLVLDVFPMVLNRLVELCAQLDEYHRRRHPGFPRVSEGLRVVYLGQEHTSVEEIERLLRFNIFKEDPHLTACLVAFHRWAIAREEWLHLGVVSLSAGLEVMETCDIALSNTRWDRPEALDAYKQKVRKALGE